MRDSIVTRDKNYHAKDCLTSNSLEEAIKLAKSKNKDEVFIIGGGQIYEQAIKFADKLYLTIVEGDYEADTFFPNYSRFKNVRSKIKMQNKQYKFVFLELTT